MAHAGMAQCRRLTKADLTSCSVLRISTTTRPAAQSLFHGNDQGSTVTTPTVTKRRTGEGQELAAYSALILQVLLLLLLLRALLLRALLQLSVTHCCTQAMLLAGAGCCCCKRAYHQRRSSDLRSYDALFVTVEPCLHSCSGTKTALLARWLWRYEGYRMPSRFGRRDL